MTPKPKKRPATVGEAEKQGNKKAAKKRRRQQKRNEEGFAENGKNDYIFNSNGRLAQPVGISRGATILACFMALWDISWVVLNNNFHNNLEEDPAITLSVRLMLEFLSIKMWIISQKKRPTLFDFFKGGLQIPFISHPMGWNRFNALNTHAWTNPHYYPYLSANFLKHWEYGESIILDEKLKKRRGKSPCIRKVPEKKSKVLPC